MVLVRRVETAERMTADEFLLLVREDEKAELIEGVMVVATPASRTHERLFRFLFSLLTVYVEHHNLGEVYGSRTAVRLTHEDVYEPDILFVAKERLGIIGEQQVSGAPDLVVEILSAASVSYDRGIKREVYGRTGVRELWLIDPYGPTGTQFWQRPPEAPGLVRVEPIEGVLRSLVLPGFWLHTNWLWPPEGEFPPVLEVLRELETA